MRFRAFALVAALCCHCTLVLAQDKPKAQITNAQKRDAAYKWERTQVVDTYNEMGKKNPKWDAAALEALDLACKWFARVPAAPSAIEVAQKASAAVKLGCDDPMVLSVFGMALDDKRRDPAALEPLRAGVAGLSKGRYHPLRLAAAATVLGQHLTVNAESAPPEADAAFKLAVAAVGKVLTTHVADPLIAEHLCGRISALPPKGLSSVYCEQIILDTQGNVATDEWMCDMFIAGYYMDRGNRARGSGFADTVTPQGRTELTRMFDLAIPKLQNAMKLEPDRPGAAMLMIGIAMEGRGDTDQKPAFWFERVVEAQFDYLPAYDAMINVLRPRWGYSYDDLLRFGMRCAASKRYDTRVPYYLVESVIQTSRELANYDKVLELKGMYEALTGVMNGLLADPSNKPFEVADRTTLASMAHRTGHFEDSAKMIAVLGDRWDRDASWEWKVARSEAAEAAAMYTCSAKELTLRARREFAAGEWDKAHASLAEALAKVGAGETDARDGILEHLDIARNKAGFERGDWTMLVIDDQAHGWWGESGTWKTNKEGGTVGTPTNGSLFLRSRTPFGNRWEMEGTIDFRDAGPEDKVNGGVVFGYEQTSGANPRWRSWLMHLDSKSSITRIGFAGKAPELLSTEAPVKAGANTFHVALWDDTISIRVNSKMVFTGPVPPARDRWKMGEGVGIGAYDTSKPVEFSGLKIRKLTRPPEGE